MVSSRHSRPGALSKSVIAILVVVVLGTAAVAVLAQSMLAVRLAVAGALAAAMLVGTTYDAALRAARADEAHERALHARTAGQLSALRISSERALASLQDTVDALTAPSSGAPDLWADAADAPTVVQLANRRETRELADEAARINETGETDRGRRRSIGTA